MLAGPVLPSMDAPMFDKNNIINVREGESLYQISRKLRRRLSGVPGFQPYLDDIEAREEEGSDPVSSLWQCFRTGLPLLAIYNASQPENGELQVKAGQTKEKVGKEAAYLFMKACKQQMQIPDTEIFTLTDLFSDNTTGFVKVTKLVNKVLDMLRLSGKLTASTDSETSDLSASTSSGLDRSSKPTTRREYILRELVDSERHYVHHLQNLQALKKQLEEEDVIAGDSIHDIFLNLNNLLDFAQRFLIRIEQQHELPEEEQDWGRLFIRYKEPFRQYEPFIANQKRCEITCAKEWSAMRAAANSKLMSQMLENPTVLNGFLIKPFQRLTKYPLLLKDLEKQTESPELKHHLHAAIEIMKDVLNSADASIDKESREDALADLYDRVEDWKGLDVKTFGELLLLGSFPVQKEGGFKPEDKEYHCYLFERILVMCKDINVAKARKKGLAATSVRGKPRMAIKGRIFNANVNKADVNSTPGNYSLTIQWKSEASNHDVFIIKFRNDENLRKWQNMIQLRRTACLLEKNNTSVSSTQLTSMSLVDVGPNPYADKEEDEEDWSRMSSTTYNDSEYNMSRNASSTSLRQRSTTGSSGTSSHHLSQGRMRGPTNELGSLPRLNTATSPGHRPGESYFSPVERDTPPQSASTRSSAQSAYQAASYRNMTPVNHEANYRNTAPAMGRDNPRGNPYLNQNGRSAQRPSLPHGAVQSANNLSMNRMRSASSPDINPQIQQARKYPGENIPAVPSLPNYVSKQMQAPNRSQNNSPNGLPVRGPPNGRPPMQPHGYTYDPAYATARHAPQLSQDRKIAAPMPTNEDDGDLPSQLKAKVRFEDNYVSMIIPTDITFRTLTDRIDAKLAKFTNHAITSGTVRLRYRDQEGEYCTIDSDDAVNDALLDWKETHGSLTGNYIGAEIALFAQIV